MFAIKHQRDETWFYAKLCSKSPLRLIICNAAQWIERACGEIYSLEIVNLAFDWKLLGVKAERGLVEIQKNSNISGSGKSRRRVSAGEASGAARHGAAATAQRRTTSTSTIAEYVNVEDGTLAVAPISLLSILNSPASSLTHSYWVYIELKLCGFIAFVTQFIKHSYIILFYFL